MNDREIRVHAGEPDAFSDDAMQQRAAMIWRSGAQRDVRADVDRDAWRKAMRAIRRARETRDGDRTGDGKDVLVLTDNDRAAAGPLIEDILILNRLAR